MTDIRGWTLKAILSIFLFPISQCFSATIYVNSSNPTPGAGTSWATAYNNLQTALSSAGLFDQIWVAQGTYKPTSPAGRSATFPIPCAVYGGFNGTETTIAQANPTLYPTILSGDIGVVGDASDNCYHVITSTASYSECHGFTIRDGRADAGSSSLAQPDNTGGGVLFLAVSPGADASTYFYNCTFTNNYAFFGAAMGSYASSASEINYNATNCVFHDNQAVYGGAIYNTNTTTDFLYNFQNDIFYNNTASSGASVFGNNITNGTTTEYIQMENCLFYNEAAPIFTNDLASSAITTHTIDFNIVWTSGTPYTSGYSSGNSPLAMTNSDISGSFALGSNIDADPLFVNAAGYDFHVSPCSPVIDQGATFAEYATDIGGSARYQGPKIDLGPYETLKGAAATAPSVTTPVKVCLNSTAVELTGDVTGSNLTWYTAATGGTGTTTTPTPVTTATGTTRYYVTQTPSGSCESSRQEIDVTINSLPAAPGFTPPPAYCTGATATQLSATGASLLWYATATGGTGTATAPTPNTTAAGTADYYVTQTSLGCESPRTDIPVIVNATPNAPAYTPVTPYCQYTPATQLSATGASLLWYATATGGTGDPTAPTPSTTTAGATTWYVSQTLGTCESPRSAITVTVNALPQISVDPITTAICPGTAVNLQANGADTYQWSPATDLSDPSISDPTASFQSNIVYTVTGTTNGCSAAAQLDLTAGTNCTVSGPGSGTGPGTGPTTNPNIGYYIPNAFSPNGDGTNDIFRVKTGDVPKAFSMSIFNRYGGKIFETADIGAGWNGTIGGNTASAGAYVYVITITSSTGELIKKQGPLILIR